MVAALKRRKTMRKKEKEKKGGNKKKKHGIIGIHLNNLIQKYGQPTTYS